MWISGITLPLALAGGIVTVVLYVSNIKTSVAEHTVQLRNLEKNHDSLTARVASEIQRVEAAFERRIAEVIDRFRSSPTSSAPSEKK